MGMLCWKGFGGGMNAVSGACGFAGWFAGKSTFSGSAAQPIKKNTTATSKKHPDVL
jgi:hypothetical protein